MRIYESKSGEPVICVFNEDSRGKIGPTPVDPRTDLLNHSPTGCTWGSSGSGPAQTALAILCDFFRYIAVEGPVGEYNTALNKTMLRMVSEADAARFEAEDLIDFIAIENHQAFKDACIATKSKTAPFRLDEAEIVDWMQKRVLEITKGGA